MREGSRPGGPAGAAHEGYAADITRTWTQGDVHPVFQELLTGVDIDAMLQVPLGDSPRTLRERLDRYVEELAQHAPHYRAQMGR